MKREERWFTARREIRGMKGTSKEARGEEEAYSEVWNETEDDANGGRKQGRGGMEGVGACARISHVSPRIRERGSPRARDFLPLQCRARFRTRRLARRQLCQSTTRTTLSPISQIGGKSHVGCFSPGNRKAVLAMIEFGDRFRDRKARYDDRMQDQVSNNREKHRDD